MYSYIKRRECIDVVHTKPSLKWAWWPIPVGEDPWSHNETGDMITTRPTGKKLQKTNGPF